MAINAYRTNAITNLDATPIVRANPWVHGGNSKQFAGTLDVVSDDTVGTTLRFFRIGSWMRPVSLVLFHDDLGGVLNLGLYRTAADGGAVVRTDQFAESYPADQERHGGVNLRFHADHIGNIEKRVWELLGLHADPNLEYDVTATLVTPLTAGGTISLAGTFSW